MAVLDNGPQDVHDVISRALGEWVYSHSGSHRLYTLSQDVRTGRIVRCGVDTGVSRVVASEDLVKYNVYSTMKNHVESRRSIGDIFLREEDREIY